MKFGSRHVVLAGERNAKLDFLCEFLNENSRVSLKEMCENSSPLIEIISSGTLERKVLADKNECRLSVLPAAFLDGIKISADFSEQEWNSCENAAEADLVLFIESFPFTTDSLCERVELIECFLMNKLKENSLQNVQFRILFFRNKELRFGDTDTVGLDAALKSASGLVEKKLESSSAAMPIGSLVDYKIYGGMAKDLFKQLKKYHDDIGKILVQTSDDTKKSIDEWSEKLSDDREELNSDFSGYTGSMKKLFQEKLSEYNDRLAELDKQIRSVMDEIQRNTKSYNDTLTLITESQKTMNSLTSKDIRLLEKIMKE